MSYTLYIQENKGENRIQNPQTQLGTGDNTTVKILLLRKIVSMKSHSILPGNKVAVNLFESFLVIYVILVLGDKS